MTLRNFFYYFPHFSAYYAHTFNTAIQLGWQQVPPSPHSYVPLPNAILPFSDDTRSIEDPTVCLILVKAKMKKPEEELIEQRGQKNNWHWLRL